MSYPHQPAAPCQGPPPYQGLPPGYGGPPTHPAPPGHPAPPAYPPPPGYPAAFAQPLPAYPSAPYYPAAAHPSGFGPFTISLVRHTGMVVVWLNGSYQVTGTLPQCERAYRDAQIHNLTAGWWSVASALVIIWISLLHNASAIRKLRRLALQPPSLAGPGYR